MKRSLLGLWLMLFHYLWKLKNIFIEETDSATKALDFQAGTTSGAITVRSAGNIHHLISGTPATETRFNDRGLDQDFRIETDTEPDAFFVDAGNNEIALEANLGPQAEMYGEELTVTLSAGVWANVTGMTNGVVSANWMAQNSSNGSITVTKGGIYKFVGSDSIEDNVSNSEEYHLAVAVDGTPMTKCEQHRSISVQAALGAVPVTCMLDLSDGSVVTMIANSVGGDNLTLEHVNWMLFR